MAEWIKLTAEDEAAWIDGAFTPLEMRTAPEGHLEVWMPHTFSAGPGSDKRCWHCDLLPLDYDKVEYDCVQDEVG